MSALPCARFSAAAQPWIGAQPWIARPPAHEVIARGRAGGVSLLARGGALAHTFL